MFTVPPLHSSDKLMVKANVTAVGNSLYLPSQQEPGLILLMVDDKYQKRPTC